LLNTFPVPGPHCLLVGNNISAFLEQAAQICAAYSDAPETSECKVNLKGLANQNSLKAMVDKKNREAFRI